MSNNEERPLRIATKTLRKALERRGFRVAQPGERVRI